jgi:hypothetical protein
MLLLGVEELRLIELLPWLLLELRLTLLFEEGRLVLGYEGLLVDDCGRTYSELERDGRLLELGRAVALVVPVLGRAEVVPLGRAVLVLMGRELIVGRLLTVGRLLALGRAVVPLMVGRAVVPFVVGRTLAPLLVLPLVPAFMFLGLLF